MTLQRRDNRHAYTGSRAFDQSCRHGGDCPWCKGRRSYRRRKGEALILDKVREYETLGSGAREEEQRDSQANS